MARHARRAPRVALRAAWIQSQSFRGIRAGTGATRASANPGLGTPKVRQVPRGPHYPPRGRGESDRATRGLRLGQQLFITTQHPGGLLARGGFRSAGFHVGMDEAGRKGFEAWRFEAKEGS